MRFSALVLFLTFQASGIVYGQQDQYCEVGNKAADILIADSLIHFPRIIVKSSTTQRKMPELEYGIKDRLYDNGSDLSFKSEEECFYNRMKEVIDAKWGVDFLESKRIESNQLDKDGMGYTAPQENGMISFLESQLKGKTLQYSGYLILLRLSTEAVIESFTIFTGIPIAFKITKKSEDYNIISETILRSETDLISASLRSRNVESELAFWIYPE